jgi:hypothetical protein
MVMDCDHMAKPDIFNRMGPCMLDENVAVTLVPQWFHNMVFPDAFDSANADFMLSKMPYAFGAGLCYITGAHHSCMHVFLACGAGLCYITSAYELPAHACVPCPTRGARSTLFIVAAPHTSGNRPRSSLSCPHTHEQATLLIERVSVCVLNAVCVGRYQCYGAGARCV